MSLRFYFGFLTGPRRLNAFDVHFEFVNKLFAMRLEGYSRCVKLLHAVMANITAMRPRSVANF